MLILSKGFYYVPDSGLIQSTNDHHNHSDNICLACHFMPMSACFIARILGNKHNLRKYVPWLASYYWPRDGVDFMSAIYLLPGRVPMHSPLHSLADSSTCRLTNKSESYFYLSRFLFLVRFYFLTLPLMERNFHRIPNRNDVALPRKEIMIKTNMHAWN